MPTFRLDPQLFALCSLVCLLGMILIDQHLLRRRIRQALEQALGRKILETEFEAFYAQNARSRWAMNILAALVIGLIQAIILSHAAGR